MVRRGLCVQGPEVDSKRRLSNLREKTWESMARENCLIFNFLVGVYVYFI